MNIIWSLILPLINVGTGEVWKKKTALTGSHIRVSRGLYYHHGIYISDDEIIHYSALDDDGLADWTKCEVVITNVQEFLKGGVLEVREYCNREKKYLHSIEHIIKKARKCVGKKGYNLIFNNCEHFANDCILGEKKSTQVQNVMFGVLSSNSLSAMFIPLIKFLIGKRNMGFLFILGALASVALNVDTNKTKTKKRKYIDTTATVRSDIAEVISDELIICEDDYNAEEFVNTSLSIQEKAEVLTQKRMQIIEQGSLDMIKMVEECYFDMLAQIKKENEDYVSSKLPGMFKILEQYAENKEVYEMYKQVIQDDISMKLKHYEKYMDMLILQQNTLIQSIIDNKNRVNKNLDALAEAVYEDRKYA